MLFPCEYKSVHCIIQYIITVRQHPLNTSNFLAQALSLSKHFDNLAYKKGGRGVSDLSQVRKVIGSIPVWDSDFLFVTCSWHVDHITSHFFTKLKIYHLSLFITQFLGLNLKGSYLSAEKENFCAVFTYSIKQVHEIMKFHAAVVQRWLKMYKKARCTCKVVVLLI